MLLGLLHILLAIAVIGALTLVSPGAGVLAALVLAGLLYALRGGLLAGAAGERLVRGKPPR